MLKYSFTEMAEVESVHLKEEHNKESPIWRPIPIVRLDQDNLEITELSDVEQDEPLDLSARLGPVSNPVVTAPSDDESKEVEIEEIGVIQEIMDQPVEAAHRTLSNNSSISSVSSSVSSFSSAVTVVEVPITRGGGECDPETGSTIKTKPPSGQSLSRSASRQNSGHETGFTSRLVMAEAAQHKAALRKKSESSGDESDKERDKSRQSVNIPIVKISKDDAKSCNVDV